MVKTLVMYGLGAFLSFFMLHLNPDFSTSTLTSTANSPAKDIVLCGPTPQSLAYYAKDKDFQLAHPLPIALEHPNFDGKKISWPVQGGERGMGYMINGNEESKEVVLVIHEWWGLNEHIKQESQKVFDELGSARVIAVDLYEGKVATNREEAGQYMQSVQEERANQIITGLIDFLGEEARIVTIGWCFGGGWSLKASLLAEEQAAGCVMYYGMPVQETEKLANLRTKVLGIFAEQDGWITPEVVNTFESNMESVGKEVEIHSYDAGHGFANPSNPDHDQEAATEAWEYTTAFMKQAFSK